MKTRQLMLSVFLCLGLYIAACNIQRFTFQTSRWKNLKSDDVRLRRPMIPSLEKHYLRPGMSKGEVEELLGQPDYAHEKRYSYELGNHLWDIDSESFYVITFSQDDRVVEFQISEK